jgi:hypothetical protein
VGGGDVAGMNKAKGKRQKAKVNAGGHLRARVSSYLPGFTSFCPAFYFAYRLSFCLLPFAFCLA